MENVTNDGIAALIQDGYLKLGQELTCPVPGVVATVAADGLRVKGAAAMDPTDAMRYVLDEKTDHDNGWIFWRLYDSKRGFDKPLEHLRVQWLSSQKSSEVRNSVTHPLRINSLSIAEMPGKIGMTFCPGKKGDAIYGGAWDRSLDIDLDVINDWGAAAVVTVMEDREFDLLGIPQFPSLMRSQPFKWFHLQIRDSDVPDQRFEAAWPSVQRVLIETLREGRDIVVHCRGGLGRTGVVAARLLVEIGLSPDQAILMVRSARPGAIETWAQEQYVRALGSKGSLHS